MFGIHSQVHNSVNNPANPSRTSLLNNSQQFVTNSTNKNPTHNPSHFTLQQNPNLYWNFSQPNWIDPHIKWNTNIIDPVNISYNNYSLLKAFNILQWVDPSTNISNQMNQSTQYSFNPHIWLPQNLMPNLQDQNLRIVPSLNNTGVQSKCLYKLRLDLRISRTTPPCLSMMVYQ